MKISYLIVIVILQTVSARRCRHRLRKPPKLVVIENKATPDLSFRCPSNGPLVTSIYTQTPNYYQNWPEFDQHFLPYQTESPYYLDYKNLSPDNNFISLNLDCKEWPQREQNIPYQIELPNFLDCKSLLSKQRTDFPDCGCKKWPINFEEFNVKEDNLALPKCNRCKSCQRNEQLILPPVQVELFEGLGYCPSAVPYVASCFEPAVEIAGKCSGANIPIASPCSCMKLASPFSAEWAPLVRSVIL